uniref:Small glutamine rich tetratricopeptide repeat co-chaperone alpha n=1 Tax=Homo sapiens TaxID=9606 RepID=A0A7I2YQY5_HUMAN
MDNKKRLAYAIIQFLHDQLRHGGLSSDAQESLEGSRHPVPGDCVWGDGRRQ